MIPGVARYHPRITWQDPKWPVIGPVDNQSNNTTAVIHYTAADNVIDGDPGEYVHQLPQYLRNMQYAYAKSKAIGGRGYSVGYSFAVDWLGGVWQLRGWEFQSAANAGHNEYTVPILVLVDGNDEATPFAVESVRAIVAEAGRRAGRALAVKGHGQLRVETGVGTVTSCPGRGLQSQVVRGVFYPVPEPPKVPIDDGEEIVIAFVATPPPEAGHNPPWILVVNGSAVYATTEAALQAKAQGIPWVPHNLEQYEWLRKSAGL
jgi:hypothetical protein